MITSIHDFQRVFFIGVAGTGMSAVAQYLAGIGKEVRGSDRYFTPGTPNETRDKLETEGIHCFLQDGSGLDESIQLVVVSTAIEDTVGEVKKARELKIPIIRRSELLAIIASSKRTIAIGGTSGKSTTSAMVFDLLEKGGYAPSIISGAGLVSIIKEGKIGNAKVGQGEWLVIEADESDGSIVQYKPEIGLLLNVDKDHKDINVLMDIFTVFKNNSQFFIVNQSHYLAKQLSRDKQVDFSTDGEEAGTMAGEYKQTGQNIQFIVDDVPFSMQVIGKHNMENAVAAIAVCKMVGMDTSDCVEALSKYEGIYRRHQIIGEKNGVILIDDYAHNPVKCARSIEACQPLAPKVIAWFQPHGYGPTKFLQEDFEREIADALRDKDEIWMSEIFYAGGTAVKDISANDLIQGITRAGKKAYFVEDRKNLVDALRPHLQPGTVLLLMGARDPSLETFAKTVWEQL